MRFCLSGNLNISVGAWASLQLAVILLTFVQARSVAGQDPEILNRSDLLPNRPPFSSAGSPSRLAFEETLIEQAREGHATLGWTELTEAASYHLRDANGSTLYQGAFPQAFVSGLEDGQHHFTVTAYDSAGQVVAVSQEPAVVVVLHWPLTQALALLAVGGVVFVALVGVLVYGATLGGAALGHDATTHSMPPTRGGPR